jgi:hypothetical protein
MVMRTPLSLSRTIAIACAVLVAASCGGSVGSVAPPSTNGATASPAGGLTLDWPAPPNPMELALKAGLKPQPKEFLNTPVHAHLDVFVDGKPVAVPAGIGVNIDDPAVQMQDMPDGTKRYGGIQLCNDPCISPLHTHGVDGILHTESAESKPNTLGEFFTEWGVALDASCVSTYCSPATTIAIYVDGTLTSGDPRAIEVKDQREIAIVIGTPPAVIPKTADFSNA